MSDTVRHRASALTSLGTAALVVGVDGSRESHAALVHAVTLARRLKASVEVVLVNDDRHSWDWDYPYKGFDPVTDARRYLDRIVDEIIGVAAGVAVARTVVTGRVVESLVQCSETASMLVLGNRGHGRLLGAMLGSVSAGCAARALCPVLIVHVDPAHPGVDTPTRTDDAAATR